MSDDVSAATMRQALAVVSGFDFFMGTPWVGVSDEGVVTLQWERDGEGVALFFAGGDTFSLSIKTGPGDHYTTGYCERHVSDGVPPEVALKIRWLAASGTAPA